MDSVDRLASGDRGVRQNISGDLVENLPLDGHGFAALVLNILGGSQEHPGLGPADIRLLVAAHEEEDTGALLSVCLITNASR